MRVGWARSRGAKRSQSLSMAYETVMPRTAAMSTAWVGAPSVVLAMAKGVPMVRVTRRTAKVWRERAWSALSWRRRVAGGVASSAR